MGLTFAIGDIHGCAEQMGQLITMIETWWPAGRIVFLGDYVDRGPDSRAVVERLMAGPSKPGWQWLALKGNHEDMMVAALRRGINASMWLANGGEETVASFGPSVSETVIDWLDALPQMHVDRHRIFVHAGVDRELGLDDQRERTLLWSRPSTDVYSDYWGRHLCHGHTPVPEAPVTVGARTNIDSGCVFGGYLTAAVFDDEIGGPPQRFIKVINSA